MQIAIPIKHFFSLLLFIILCGMQAGAQSGNVLYGEVEAAQKRGIPFREYNLFSYAGPATMLDGGSLLVPQALNIATLYNEQPSAISIQLPSANGRYTLSMLRGNATTTDMQALVADAQGTHTTSFDKGVHYTGCVEGQAHTLATMSVFANGDVMILFANKDGNYVLGKLQDNSNSYILYRDDAIKGLPPYECKVKDDNAPQQTGEKTTGMKGTCKVIRVYLEGDYDLYKKFSKNLTQTQNYLTGVFNQVKGLYKNDSMILMLGSIKVWTSADNYKDTTSEHAIIDFINAWNYVNDTFNGDIAVLVANDIRNNGGIAPLRTLCTKSNSYAYADVEGTYKTIPVYSKDVMVIAHEIGHLFGSMHTHWCGWNTYGSSICGSIDNCSQQESGGACINCPTLFDDSAPATAWAGTIMSYCHTKGRGINLANGFGPLPGKEMRDNINNTSINTCLENAIKATLQIQNICNGYGAITVVFDTNYINNKTLPPSSLMYYWTTGATTPNLINITIPGAYGVSITDSNGNCQIQYIGSVSIINTDSCRFRLSTGSIKESAPTTYNISPNPSDGFTTLTISDGDKTNYDIVITDMLGKVCLQTSNRASVSTAINIKSLSSGVYTINIMSEKSRHQLKMIVE